MKANLPLSKQITYALGQLGWSMLSGIIGTYVIFYYIPTQESGIKTYIPQVAFLGFLTIIGIITMVGRLFDAVTDPWIATLSDKSKSRFGRRISFMRFSAIPFAVFTVLVFYNPVQGQSIVNALFLSVTLLLYYLFYTMYVTPYFALMSELGHTPKQRLDLSTYISFTWFFGFALASLAPNIWTIFVNNGMVKEDAMRLTFTIMAAVALVLLFLPVFTINEKEYCESVPSKLNMMESIKATFSNREFTKYVLSDFAYWIAITVFQTTLIYYITVLLGLAEAFNGTAMMILGGLSFLFYVPVNMAAKHIGKKLLLIIAFVMFTVIYCFSFFLGLLPMPVYVQIGILIFIASIPMAVFGILPNAVIADIAEYNSLKTGIRREAMFFGTRTFVSKLGQMISMLVVSALLQIKDNNIGIRLTTVAAAVFCLFGLFILFGYNEKKILKGLREGGEKGA